MKKNVFVHKIQHIIQIHKHVYVNKAYKLFLESVSVYVPKEVSEMLKESVNNALRFNRFFEENVWICVALNVSEMLMVNANNVLKLNKFIEVNA